MKKLFATITAIAMLTGCAVEHTSSNVYRGMEALHGGQVEHASVVRVRAVIIQSSVTPGYGAFSGLAGIAGAIVGSVVGSQAIGGGRGRYVAAAIAGPVAGIVAQQMESAVIFGLTAALYGRIDIKDGQVVQSNFPDYPALKMAEVPIIETHIVPSTAEPTGVGEVGVPPIAPAVAHAVAQLTGKPVRQLPMV